MPSFVRSPAWRWALGLAVVTSGSWVRWLLTGSLKIDENYPPELSGSLLFVALLLGWALVVSGWVGFLEQPPERPRRLAYGGLAIVALMLPLLSNDIYCLLANAGLAVQGQDVYTSAQALPNSPWFSWIGDRWRTNPSPYGPLALLFAAWPSVAGSPNPFLAIFLLRLTWLVPLVAVMELSFRVFRDRPFFQAMLWLNPLLLIEGPGQLHLDLLGALAITAGLLAQSAGPRAWGALGWAGATLFKWNDVVVAPWFWLAGARSWRERLRSVGLMAVMLAALAGAAYLPFWRGPETLREPFRALFAQTLVPGGGVVDVVGELGSMLGGKSFDPNQPVVERVARQQQTRAAIWHVAQTLMSLLALVAVLPLVKRFFQRGLAERARDDERIALATGTFVVIVLTLASPKFQSWYLMSALPFFGLCCPPAWRRWWPWVVFAAVAQELPLALPRGAALFAPAVAFGTGLSAIVFLWSFRARYWPKDAGAKA